MSDWLTYELVHLVPFSADVYERLIVRVAQGAWPYTLLAAAAGLFALQSAWRGSSRVAMLIQGAALATSSWLFVSGLGPAGGYADLHWAAGSFAVGFFATGLAWCIASIKRLQLKTSSPSANRVGAAALAVIAIAFPAIGWVTGGPGEWFAVHADPTALAGVGIAVLVRRGLTRWALSAPCILWLALSSLTLIGLGRVNGYALAVITIISAVITLWPERESVAAQ